MKDSVEERVLLEAYKLIDTNGTVRSVAKMFNMSKSTIHFDVTQRLKKINFDLYKKVQKVLKINLLERHKRGGEATKRKYKEAKKTGKNIG